MLTRREARRRLIARWHSAVAELPARREPLFGLQRFVTEENIQVVQSLGLYASHSDERRDRELIAAGCRRDVGGLRNRVFARTGRRTHANEAEERPTEIGVSQFAGAFGGNRGSWR
jgi:hypothetical protein